MKSKNVSTCFFYVSSLISTSSVNFQYQNAQQLSKQSAVVFFNVIEPQKMIWESLFRLLRLYLFLRKRQAGFFEWKLINFFPGAKSYHLQRKNMVLNGLILRVLSRNWHEKIVINTTIEPKIEALTKHISPKLTFSEVFDIFGDEMKTYVDLCDYVLVNSQGIYDLAKTYTENVQLIPGGFFSESTIRALRKNIKYKPNSAALISATITWRVNFDRLLFITAQLKSMLLVVAGPELFDYYINDEWNEKNRKAKKKWQKLQQQDNFLHIPMENQDGLKDINQEISLGIVPIDSKLTLHQYSNPIKLYHYFAMGLPVVGPDIIAMRNLQLPQVKVAKSNQEYCAQIETLRNMKLTSSQRNSLYKRAAFHTYEHKVEVLHKLINELPASPGKRAG